jgi:nucleoside-diphosphate-sugar epimerase
MRVLLVGGAGHVGTAIAPYLQRQHELRVLDVREPAHEVEWIAGSATDVGALDDALDGVDAVINLLMRSPQGGASTEQTVTQIVENYETNTLALHLLLFTAQTKGVTGVVHTSSMSVHHRARSWYWSEEGVPRDSPSVYGLTKGLGEEICEYFARWFRMNIVALRLTAPRTRAQFLDERRSPPPTPGTPTGHLYVTDEEDLARAYLAALEVVRVGHSRFEAVFIAGDEAGEEHNLAKARRILGWEPRSHRLL